MTAIRLHFDTSGAKDSGATQFFTDLKANLIGGVNVDGSGNILGRNDSGTTRISITDWDFPDIQNADSKYLLPVFSPLLDTAGFDACMANQTPTGVSGSRALLGDLDPYFQCGLTGKANYQLFRPFINQFREASPWDDSANGLDYRALRSAGNIGSDGQIDSLPASGRMECLLAVVPQISDAYTDAESWSHRNREHVFNFTGDDTDLAWNGVGTIATPGPGNRRTATPTGLDDTTMWINTETVITDPYICITEYEDLLLSGCEWDPDYVRMIQESPVRIIRFMDIMSTNDNDTVTDTDVVDENYLFWNLHADGAAGEEGGLPFNLLVKLANLTGKDPWFCVPWQADTDYMNALATAIYNGLNPDLKVYIELSNENWNNQFLQATLGSQAGRELFTDATIDAGGSGHAVDDELTFTQSPTNWKFRVTAESSGAVTAVIPIQIGSGLISSATQASTTGSGTGCQISATIASGYDDAQNLYYAGHQGGLMVNEFLTVFGQTDYDARVVAVVGCWSVLTYSYAHYKIGFGLWAEGYNSTPAGDAGAVISDYFTHFGLTTYIGTFWDSSDLAELLTYVAGGQTYFNQQVTTKAYNETWSDHQGYWDQWTSSTPVSDGLTPIAYEGGTHFLLDSGISYATYTTLWEYFWVWQFSSEFMDGVLIPYYENWIARGWAAPSQFVYTEPQNRFGSWSIRRWYGDEDNTKITDIYALARENAGSDYDPGRTADAFAHGVTVDQLEANVTAHTLGDVLFGTDKPDIMDPGSSSDNWAYTGLNGGYFANIDTLMIGGTDYYDCQVTDNTTHKVLTPCNVTIDAGGSSYVGGDVGSTVTGGGWTFEIIAVTGDAVTQVQPTVIGSADLSTQTMTGGTGSGLQITASKRGYEPYSLNASNVLNVMFGATGDIIAIGSL